MGYESSLVVPQEAGVAASAPAPAASNARAFLGILSAAMLAAIALRFWSIGERSLWLDEGYSAWFSELSWSRLWFETPLYETHPPLYYSMLKLWREFAGDGAAALRSLSAIAGIAAVPIIAVAAQSLGRTAGVARPLTLVAIACGLAALSPRLLVIAQDARPYAILLLAYAVSIACWLRLTLCFRTSPSDGRLSDWLGLGLGTALTLWLHGLGLLHAAALLGALMLTGIPGATRRRLQRMIVTVGLVGLSYLPCLFMILERRGDWSGGWVQWDPIRFPGALLDLYGFHEQTEIWTPIAARIVFALLIALGLRRLWRCGDRPVALGLALLVLFPPLSAALLSELGTPVFVPRTLVAVLAPAYLVAALGLAQMPRRAAMLVGGTAALILAINLAETLARPSLEAWDEVAATLKQEMAPDDVIWVYPNDAAIAVERARGNGAAPQAIPAPFPALHAAGSRPAGSPAVVGIDGAAARQWAAAHAPKGQATIWLVIGNAYLFDPQGEVARGLASGRRAGRLHQWRQIRLQPLYSKKAFFQPRLSRRAPARVEA